MSLQSDDFRLFNINEAHRENLTVSQRIADAIAGFSGSIPFLVINLVIFVGWIIVNTLGPPSVQIDRFPFLFLTMAVSLEAIFLSIFVLISQNLQASKDRLRAEQDYYINVKAEREILRLLDLIESQEKQGLVLLEKIDLLLQRTGKS